MKQNTITTLLAAIAVLLGVNFVSGGSMQSAQVEPTVVAGSATQEVGTDGTGLDQHRVFRFWSDGAVDTTLVDFDGQPPHCDIDSTCYRQVLLGSCQSDINRNAEVEVTDFLQLIGEWGPCSP